MSKRSLVSDIQKTKAEASAECKALDKILISDKLMHRGHLYRVVHDRKSYILMNKQDAIDLKEEFETSNSSAEIQSIAGVEVAEDDDLIATIMLLSFAGENTFGN